MHLSWGSFLAFKEALDALNDREASDYAMNVAEDRNSSIVQITPLATALLGCHTNSVHLGAMEDAKNALFYVVKYLLKDKVELASSLGVVKYAMDKIQRFPSVAEDTHTDFRTGKHFLQVILNKLVGMKEIADT